MVAWGRAGTEKYLWVAGFIETKRCSPPEIGNPALSTQIFGKVDGFFLHVYRAACERSLSVMILLGMKPQRFITLTGSRFAARLHLLD